MIEKIETLLQKDEKLIEEESEEYNMHNELDKPLIDDNTIDNGLDCNSNCNCHYNSSGNCS